MVDNRREREELLAYVIKHGWTLDPEAKTGLPPRTEADPYVFMRQSTTSPVTVWKVHLDFGGGDVLRKITIANTYRPLPRNDPRRWQRWKLSWADYNSTRALFQVTNDRTPFLRRAERVLADPDMYIWLAAEREHTDIQEYREHERKRHAG